MNDKKEGNGCYTWPDGRKYNGQWKDGKKHGQGTLICYDGAMYEGNWKEGKPNGQGTETLPNGKKYVGKWINGERSKGAKYNKYGKIIGKFENGKWIKK